MPIFLRTKRRAFAAFIVFNVVGTYVYVWLPEKWRYEENMRKKAAALEAAGNTTTITTESDSGADKSS